LDAYSTTMPSGTAGVHPSKGLTPSLDSWRSFLALATYCAMPPGYPASQYGSLREEPPLVVVVGAGRGPVGEQVVLAALDELVDHGVLIGVEDVAVRREGRRLAFLVCERVIVGGQR
jgi:hypothetical protein